MVDRLDESEKLRFADALNLLAKEDELALEMVPQAGDG